MVWVPQQLVGASLGATVTIECWLEAHPAALHYWSRPDGQVLHDPSKYRIESINSAAVMSNRSAYTVSSKSIMHLSYHLNGLISHSKLYNYRASIC